MLRPNGVCGVVDLREKTADDGTWKVGTAIPLWHLPKIWPDMPGEVGEILFGKHYWPILQGLSAQTDRWTSSDLRRAFSRVIADTLPEDDSLWGYARALGRYEDQDQPVGNLSEPWPR